MKRPVKFEKTRLQFRNHVHYGRTSILAGKDSGAILMEVIGESDHETLYQSYVAMVKRDNATTTKGTT